MVFLQDNSQQTHFDSKDTFMTLEGLTTPQILQVRYENISLMACEEFIYGDWF